MEIGDAFVRIDHGQRRTPGEDGLQVGFDGAFLRFRQVLDFSQQVAQTVVEIDAQLLQHSGVPGDEVPEEHFHRMSEEDRIGHLHHRGLEVEGKKNTHLPCFGDLLRIERDQRLPAHERAVEHLARLQLDAVFEHDRCPVCGNELDFHRGGFRHRHRLLVREKVVMAHGGHACLGARRPGAHLVRMLAGVVLHRFGCAAVGVSFAQDRVDRAAFDPVVDVLDAFLRVICRCLRVIRDRKALFLQLDDGGFELRERGADIRKFDDIGLGAEGQRAEFRQRVRGSLAAAEEIGENRQNAPGQRDVARLDRNAGGRGEGLDDRQQ